MCLYFLDKMSNRGSKRGDNHSDRGKRREEFSDSREAKKFRYGRYERVPDGLKDVLTVSSDERKNGKEKSYANRKNYNRETNKYSSEKGSSGGQYVKKDNVGRSRSSGSNKMGDEHKMNGVRDKGKKSVRREFAKLFEFRFGKPN